MLPSVRAIGANISDGAMPRSIASPHRARVRRCPHARARSSPDILPYRAVARVLRPSRTWTPSIGASRAASSWIWRRKFSIVSILGRPSRARVARVYEIADGARARMDKHRPRFRGRRGRAVARARRRDPRRGPLARTLDPSGASRYAPPGAFPRRAARRPPTPRRLHNSGVAVS